MSVHPGCWYNLQGDNEIEAAAIFFAVAPLNEQHRIVAKIEDLLTRLDAGVASLKRAQANLKRYKASVLKTACEGRLVPTEAELARAEGRSYEAASELLQRILVEREGRGDARRRPLPQPPDTRGLPELPEGWCYTFLKPLLSFERTGLKTGPFGSLLKKHEHRDQGIPVLGIENVEPMRFVAGSKIHITLEKAARLSEYVAVPADLLLTRSGTVGQVCVVPEGIGDVRIQRT